MKLKKLLYNQKAAPYVMIFPFILVFLVFFLYSIVYSFLMSFYKFQPGVQEFIGIKNYQRLSDGHFLNAIWNNTRYVFWAIVILVPISLLIALMLNTKMMPGKKLFRACVFVPSLTSVIVAGIVFRMFFSGLDTGFINSILLRFGMEPHDWLRENQHTAMLAMVSLTVWRWIGPTMLYFLAALQNVSPELLEAAEIDGASSLKKFFYITVPQIKPILIYVITIQIYGGFSMFTESFVYWNTTSPNDIGLTMVVLLYQKGFVEADMGYSYAIGVVLLVIIFTASFLQLRSFGMFRRDEG